MSRADRTPPRLATRILKAILGAGPDGASILGDLFEEHRALLRGAGALRADLWYWRQVLGTGMGYARPGRATLDRLRQDLRTTIRGLRREPGFTLAVVTTLALGIGAGTAIFSVVDGVLLRPLPYDAPEQLVRIWAASETSGDPYVDFMYADIPAFAEAASFRDVSALSLAPRIMMDERGEDRENVRIGRTTPDLFATLGIEPVLGRIYTAEDAAEGRRLLVISHELWRRRFTASPDAIGRFVHLDVTGYEIVGVLPPGMAYPEGTDAWRALTPADVQDDDREVHLVARLEAAATPTAANSEVASIAAGLAERTPESHAGLSAWIQPLQATVVRDVRTALFALLGAVGLVLLIACVNTASLLLARSSRRSHEVAVRISLGASRGRIAAQRLTESLVLAGLGGIAGLLLGRWVLASMLRIGPELPRLASVSLDLRVVAVMASVTAGAGVLFGVVPAVSAAGTPPERTLRERSPTGTGGRRRHRLQSGLVTTEIALSTILGVLALLLFSTFRTAITYDRGFQFDRLVAITVDPMHPPAPGDATREYFGDIVDRVRALPGVRDAALSSHPILEPRGFRLPVQVEGLATPTPTPMAYANVVSEGFFATAGVALVEGRPLSAEGGVDGDLELVVNQRFARTLLADLPTPLGARIDMDWLTGHVVGVVRDVETELGEPALPKVYVSMRRETVAGMSLTVRTLDEPAAVVPSIRREIEAVDENVLLEDVTVVEQAVRTSVAPQRFNMWLVVSFAALALALAGVGIYGVTAFSVEERRSEIGIRRALGASDGRVVRQVMRRVAALTIAGVGAGLLGAVSGGKLVSSLLVGVDPTEPTILLAVVALLGAIALVAATLPVLRALRVDPTESLRAE